MTSDTSTTIEDGPFSFSIHLYPGKHVECSCRKLQTRVALHEDEYSRDQFNKYFWLLLLLERSARLNNFLIPGCRSLLQSVYVSHYHLHYHHLCHSQSRTMLNFGFNYRNHHPTPIWMGNLYLCTLWLFLSLQHILSRLLPPCFPNRISSTRTQHLLFYPQQPQEEFNTLFGLNLNKKLNKIVLRQATNLRRRSD